MSEAGRIARRVNARLAAGQTAVLIVRRGLADVLDWLGEDVVPGHTCDTPFWRFHGEPDGDRWRWVCPVCWQTWYWEITTGTVPGVPAEVCVVYSNRWVKA